MYSNFVSNEMSQKSFVLELYMPKLQLLVFLVSAMLGWSFLSNAAIITSLPCAGPWIRAALFWMRWPHVKTALSNSGWQGRIRVPWEHNPGRTQGHVYQRKPNSSWWLHRPALLTSTALCANTQEVICSLSLCFSSIYSLSQTCCHIHISSEIWSKLSDILFNRVSPMGNCRD